MPRNRTKASEPAIVCSPDVIGRDVMEVGGRRTGRVLGLNNVKGTIRISLDPDSNPERVHVSFSDWGKTWQLKG